MRTKNRRRIVRKLDRPNISPSCLNRFQRTPNAVWNDLRRHDRAEIWLSIIEMQENFCAYCQCKINPHSKNSFIEHFFRRDDFPKKTFDWNNLFGSCNNKETCGNYKDHQAKKISPDHICKPDIHDPKKYLQFLANGKVQPKPDIAQQHQTKAENTIEAFNLKHSSLVNRRRTIAEVEVLIANQLYEFIELFPDDPELLQEHQEHLLRINKEEFSAVRHTVWNSQ